MPRLKYASALRALVVLGLLCLWVQIMLSVSNGAVDRDAESQNASNSTNTDTPIAEELMNSNDTSEQVLALVPPELHKYLTVHSKNSTANVTERASPRNVTDIRRAVERSNAAQVIHNEELFGPVQNDTVIIAIQVSSDDQN
ncbi:unnamed protein product, partial [Iphiclides podalirius]